SANSSVTADARIAASGGKTTAQVRRGRNPNDVLIALLESITEICTASASEIMLRPIKAPKPMRCLLERDARDDQSATNAIVPASTVTKTTYEYAFLFI